MATTEGYIKHAEKYYRSLSLDWISCALKPQKIWQECTRERFIWEKFNRMRF